MNRAAKWVVVGGGVLVVGFLIALMVNRVNQTADEATNQRARIEELGRYLVDCTTPGPLNPADNHGKTGHPCYDQQNERTGQAIASIQKSIDCVALYAVEREPEPCHEVDARLKALERGEDPFIVPPKGQP